MSSPQEAGSVYEPFPDFIDKFDILERKFIGLLYDLLDKVLDPSRRRYTMRVTRITFEVLHRISQFPYIYKYF